MATSWMDSPEGYGRVSRAFHWGMAILFAWQFAGAILFVSIGDSALTRFVGGTHFDMGFTLFVLVLLRGGWGLLNMGHRPPHQGTAGKAAVAGHLLLYGMMIFIPGIALLRQYGTGDAFSPWGIPLMPHRGTKIEWMMAPANLLHYWLGFALLAVVVGHSAMVLLHRVLWREDVISRMTRGRDAPDAVQRPAALR
ncbi:cytochrome b [Roseomonas sp. BN140053]|uniref:cytochrome b n=1 Tax=Roseomonas sp. BN140053 TaxID=3391898 RepID=UPI0039ED0956